MPRTLNPVAHAVRRDAFVEAAQRLIAIKGYEELSIQDVLDEVGASKGAFYHYFDSKQSLLAAVIERMTDAVASSLEPIVSAPDLDAATKLEAIFTGISRWKGDRKEFMLEILRVWLSDENAAVREQLRAATTRRLTPLLVTVLCQGADEGTFSIAYPEYTADVVISLILGAGERSTRLFFARQANEIPFEEIERFLAAFTEALDRALGLPPGSLKLSSPETLHTWFG